jgi:primosomal protein N' (replication factor Y) (superfamily II helicase)
VPYASVYPLVSARSLARPFTYEVGDDVEKGAVLSLQFGASKRRGVVVALEDEPPAGVDPIAAGRILDELPASLVDLALWTADYYGSTPARALALVAPPNPARRGERRSPSSDYALGGEAEPLELSEPQRAALARIEAAAESGGGHFLLYGATGSGKTEVYLQA